MRITAMKAARRLAGVLPWLAAACMTAACAGREEHALNVPEAGREQTPAATPAPAPPVATPAVGKSYVVKGKRYTVLRSADGFYQRGKASWYGRRFHGRKTAGGERFDQNAPTAAHTTLPMNTWVEVKNFATGKTVHVRINDRGPFTEDGVIDLSRSAAARLGVLGGGEVEVRAVSGPGPEARADADAGKRRVR
jgi:rare lipoprotein A